MTASEGRLDLEQRSHESGEVTINYMVGAGSGPPLLLLHGVISGWRSFESLIPYLADTAQIFAMDLRGHGKPGWVGNGYRAEGYAQDAVRLIQAEVKEPAIILGHSLGALVVIQATALLQQEMRAVVIVDPPLVYHWVLLKDSPSKRDRSIYIWFLKAAEIKNSSQSSGEIENKLAQIFRNQSIAGRRNLADWMNDMDLSLLGKVIAN